MNKNKKKKSVNISTDAMEQLNRQRNEKRIISNNTPFDIIESYKALRTNIMFSLNKEKGCKKVVITSATSGEGKTTSCINVAKTFAQTGVRVLVVDADLRAPRIHKYLNLTNEKGLSNILAGFDKVDDCIMKTSEPNLDCIIAGAIPPNPVELISSDAMKEFLSEVEQKYDYVFFDTPPLNIVTEAVILSKLVTGTILITRQKYTMYKMVERAINSLNFADAKILGFILNDAVEDSGLYGSYRAGGRKHGRYYKYAYYSAYRSSAEKVRAREAAKAKEAESKASEQ